MEKLVIVWTLLDASKGIHAYKKTHINMCTNLIQRCISLYQTHSTHMRKGSTERSLIIS